MLMDFAGYLPEAEQKNGQNREDIILTRALGERYHFQPLRWASVNTF